MDTIDRLCANGLRKIWVRLDRRFGQYFRYARKIAKAWGVRVGLALSVKIQKSGGAYYTTKDIGTVFGGMPLHLMGGAVVSFVLMESHGKIEDAGVFPVHGGFVMARTWQGISPNVRNIFLEDILGEISKI